MRVLASVLAESLSSPHPIPPHGEGTAVHVGLRDHARSTAPSRRAIGSLRQRPRRGSLALAPASAVALLALAVAACGRPPAPKTEAKEPPPLPADVQAVASAATPAQTTPESSAARDVFTGEFVSPVRSELVAEDPRAAWRRCTSTRARACARASRCSSSRPTTSRWTCSARSGRGAREGDARRRGARPRAQEGPARQGLDPAGHVRPLAGHRSSRPRPRTSGGRAGRTAPPAARRLDLALADRRRRRREAHRRRRAPRRRHRRLRGRADRAAQAALPRARALPRRARRRAAGRARPVDPYPDERSRGSVKTVGGVIDPATRTMFVEAEFANRDGRLRPGLFARWRRSCAALPHGVRTTCRNSLKSASAAPSSRR